MRRVLSLHHQTPRPSYKLGLPPALAREGWTIGWSRRRARWYYFNEQTNASTWEQPVVPKKTVRRFAARPGAPPPSISLDRAQETELAFRFQYPEPWFREGVRPRGAPRAAAEQSAPAPPANPGQIWPRVEMVPGRSGMELQHQCAVCFAPLDGRVCARCDVAMPTRAETGCSAQCSTWTEALVVLERPRIGLAAAAAASVKGGGMAAAAALHGMVVESEI